MATTINAANISIGMDITKLKEGMGASRTEISKIGSILRETEQPASKFKREMELMNRALHAGAITVEQYANAQEKLAKKYGIVTPAMERQLQKEKELEQQEQRNIARLERFQQSLERLRRQTDTADPLAAFGKPAQASEQNMLGLTGAIGKFATAATLATAAYKSFQIVQDGFNLAINQEQILAQLEVLTGSSETAKLLTDDFIKLDRQSALTAANFQEAAKLLLGYGMAASQVTPTLDRLSEISMGNQERFQSLALAFGQVQAQGRLMGQEVLQMVNAGFNPLQEISRTTGIGMLELKKQMEAGAVTAEMVAEAFRSATSEGGRFNDMNEKMSETTAVKMSKLANEWQMFKRSLGEEVKPGVNKALDAITGTIESARSFGPWFDEFWATATGNANEFYAARERSLRIEQEYQANLENQNKQLEESKRLAKERADIEAAAAKDQEERELAAEKRIAAEREAFARRGEQEFEKMQRATMGDAEFERRQITNPNFDMTEAERIQAAETLDNMAETRRQNAMTQLRQELETSKKRVEDEIKIADMRKQGVLGSDEDRRKAVNIQNQFAAQQQAEQQRLAARIAEIKRQGGGDAKLDQEFIDRAKRDSEFRMQEIRQTADAALTQLGTESQLGAMQKQQSSLEQERQRILGAQGPNVAATIAPAIKAGTVEAYKAVNQQNEQRAARAEQVAELKRINASLDKLNSEKAVLLTRIR